MNVVYTRAPAHESLRGVSTAKCEVPGVEDDANVGQLKEPLDLPGRLHVRPGVVMEAHVEAALLGELGGARDSFREAPPAVFVQAQRAVRGGPAGIGQSLRRAVVGEDGVRFAAAGGLKEVERPRHGRKVLVPVVGLAHPDGDEASGESQAGVCQSLTELLAGSQVAGWSELGGLVAGPSDCRHHLVRARHVGEHSDGDLEGAVRAGCVRDPYARQPRRPSRVTSGTRGSFSIASQAGRTQASSGSSAAAIERRSPASAFR